MMNNNSLALETTFAIVSPCSVCKNQLSEQSADGKPFCPRRKWQADQALAQSQEADNLDPALIPLVAFGTEGTPAEGDNSLRNPVYLDSGKASLVWIATLRDNSGVRDADNQVIAPSILDPSFIPDKTEYINCRSLPYIPAQHESAYRQVGALKEGDVVIATPVQNSQHDQYPSATDGNANEYTQIMIEGVVSKTNLVYSVPRAAIEVDHNVQGS